MSRFARPQSELASVTVQCEYSLTSDVCLVAKRSWMEERANMMKAQESHHALRHPGAAEVWRFIGSGASRKYRLRV